MCKRPIDYKQSIKCTLAKDGPHPMTEIAKDPTTSLLSGFTAPFAMLVGIKAEGHKASACLSCKKGTIWSFEPVNPGNQIARWAGWPARIHPDNRYLFNKRMVDRKGRRTRHALKLFSLVVSYCIIFIPGVSANE